MNIIKLIMWTSNVGAWEPISFFRLPVCTKTYTEFNFREL